MLNWELNQIPQCLLKKLKNVQMIIQSTAETRRICDQQNTNGGSCAFKMTLEPSFMWS